MWTPEINPDPSKTNGLQKPPVFDFRPSQVDNRRPIVDILHFSSKTFFFSFFSIFSGNRERGTLLLSFCFDCASTYSRVFSPFTRNSIFFNLITFDNKFLRLHTRIFYLPNPTRTSPQII